MNTPQFDLGAMLSAPQTAILQIPCDQLHPYHNHKFELYSGERLEDMVASIKENGVLSPIIVQPIENGYEILIGHNRWNASKLAGLPTVPAIVKTGLTEEEAVEEVEAFLIKLKTSEIDLNILRQMDRQLHYHLIFILEFEEQYQIWTGYKEESTNAAFKVGNYYHTDWVTEESFSLRIDGLNMDTVYENLVRQIAGDTLTQENSESLKETVERQLAREKLEKDIEKLRGKIRKEKQFNRQVELNKQLKTLLKQLEE